MYFYFLTTLFLQRKSTNFYSSANVKNKNREKASKMKQLQKGISGRKRRA